MGKMSANEMDDILAGVLGKAESKAAPKPVPVPEPEPVAVPEPAPEPAPERGGVTSPDKGLDDPSQFDAIMAEFSKVMAEVEDAETEAEVEEEAKSEHGFSPDLTEKAEKIRKILADAANEIIAELLLTGDK